MRLALVTDDHSDLKMPKIYLASGWSQLCLFEEPSDETSLIYKTHTLDRALTEECDGRPKASAILRTAAIIAT